MITRLCCNLLTCASAVEEKERIKIFVGPTSFQCLVDAISAAGVLSVYQRLAINLVLPTVAPQDFSEVFLSRWAS